MKKNIIISKTSGNASKNSYQYKFNVPAEMAKKIGITPEDREVNVDLIDGKIVISKANNMS